jgi:hypothetical protein
MVKFGGVRNHIVATWDPADLEACADLNLPCADVTSLLPEPMDNGPNAGAFGTHDYFVRGQLVWGLLPVSVLVLLQMRAWPPACAPILCPLV